MWNTKIHDGRTIALQWYPWYMHLAVSTRGPKHCLAQHSTFNIQDLHCDQQDLRSWFIARFLTMTTFCLLFFSAPNRERTIHNVSPENFIVLNDKIKVHVETSSALVRLRYDGILALIWCVGVGAILKHHSTSLRLCPLVVVGTCTWISRQYNGCYRLLGTVNCQHFIPTQVPDMNKGKTDSNPFGCTVKMKKRLHGTPPTPSVLKGRPDGTPPVIGPHRLRRLLQSATWSVFVEGKK